MSELKTAEPHDAPLTGEAQSHEHPVNFENYLRRCLYIFIAILCATSLMIWISFLPERYTWAAKVGMILSVAAANAWKSGCAKSSF